MTSAGAAPRAAAQISNAPRRSQSQERREVTWAEDA